MPAGTRDRNRTVIRVSTYGLFALGAILALSTIFEYTQARPHIMSRAEAVNATVAWQLKYFNQTLDPERPVNATLYHRLANGTTFVVDDKTLRDQVAIGKFWYIQLPYWWRVDIGRDYLVDATTGQIVGGNPCCNIDYSQSRP